MRIEIRFMAPVNRTIEADSVEIAAKEAAILAESKGWRLLGVATPEEWATNGTKLEAIKEVKP